MLYVLLCFITACQLPHIFSYSSLWTSSHLLKATFWHTANPLMRPSLWRKMAARNAWRFKPASAADTASPRWIYSFFFFLFNLFHITAWTILKKWFPDHYLQVCRICKSLWQLIIDQIHVFYRNLCTRARSLPSTSMCAPTETSAMKPFACQTVALVWILMSHILWH